MGLVLMQCRTLLFDQASKGKHELVALLIQKGGANVNAKDQTGSTPLHRAAGAGEPCLSIPIALTF